MLTHPVIVLSGAKQGISLWIESVVPSLLPYMILSNFLIYAGISADTAIIMKPAARLLKLPDDAAYCILAGLLFGYPACAVSAVSLYREGRIDKHAAAFLSCSFNNISPAFIAGFVCAGILKNTSMIAPVLILFYIIILLSTIIIKFTFFRGSYVDCSPSAPESGHSGNFFDMAVINSLTNIARLAGYIIVFSIAANLVLQIPLPCAPFICAVMEVTTGLNALADSIKNMHILLLLIIPALAFGGISGIFQTFGVDTDNVINRRKYILSKLITMAVAFVCTYLFMIIFKIQ